MPTKADYEKEYQDICGYWEGAHYCKMDLHTHTPASECSSFTLPAVVEDVFPKTPKRKTKKEIRQTAKPSTWNFNHPFVNRKSTITGIF